MIPIYELVELYNDDVKVIAGLDSLSENAMDIALLTNDRVWTASDSSIDYGSKLVWVQSAVIPAFSSSLDILIRFLKGAGAVGIIYSGGKYTDFSRATCMLADNLRLPILWVSSSLSHFAVVREFYWKMIRQEQGFASRLGESRRRLETALHDAVSLASWIDAVETELQVRVKLIQSAHRTGGPQSRWRELNGERCLDIPLSMFDDPMLLRLTPLPNCRLYALDVEAQWIAQLAGVLSVVTTHFLLKETPGLFINYKWAQSLENGLFSILGSLPMLNVGQPNMTTHSENGSRLASVAHRVSAITIEGESVASLLWLTWPARQSNETKNLVPIMHTPYVYRGFEPTTLELRELMLSYLNHPRYITTNTWRQLTCCVPWRDWERNEGLLVLWYSPKDSTAPSQQVVHDIVEQLDKRLQISIRATFAKQALEYAETGHELLHHTVPVLEKTFYSLVSMPDGVFGVQYVQNPEDIASLMIYNAERSSPYDQAAQLLAPLLRVKNGDALLQTLETFVNCGGKAVAAANKLILHRNALRYRLKRIEAILGVDLANPQTRFSYELAIRSWRWRQSQSAKG